MKRSPLFSNLVALCGALTLASCAASRRPAERVGKGDFYTTTYLSKVEALRTVFPDAHQVFEDHVRLADAELNDIEKLIRSRLRQRTFTVYVGVDENNEIDGFAVVQQEIGKFKLFTFIVGVQPDGTVRRVAVMVYRESRGGEVAQRRHLVQYDGKSVKAPLSINRDIINTTGATMSVNSMNRGVKKVLAVINVLYHEQPKRVQRVLAERREVAGFAASQTTAEARGEDGVEHHRQDWRELRESRLLMGALCRVELWGKDLYAMRSALDEAFLEVERVDRAISDYRPDSELSRISASAGGTPIDVSPETYDFLERGLAISRASNGAFDLTIGPAVDAWGFRGGTPREPSPSDLHSLAQLVDYRKIQMRAPHRVGLEQAEMRLDPGGLGKGYAVDRAIEKLKEFGVQKALVNFSGTIYALGSLPDREGWPVAVRDPIRPNRTLGHVFLRDQAIASSGGYEKFVAIDQKDSGQARRFGHILSPTSLRPVSGVLGTTVLARNATLADGWSTALAVLGVDGLRILDRQRDLHDLAGLVVNSDGERTSSSAWPTIGKKIVPMDLNETQKGSPGRDG